jgi:selenocysteine-specific elongation factor
LASKTIHHLLEGSLDLVNISHWSDSMNRSIDDLLGAVVDHSVAQLEVNGSTYLLGSLAEQSFKDKVIAGLTKFHSDEPDEPGVAMERLRRMAIPSLNQDLFKAWVACEIKQQTLSLSGSFIHLPSHKVELTQNETIIWEKIYPKLLDGRYDPPWVRDLASALSEPEANIRLLLRKVSRTSALVQLVPDLFYPIATMRIMADIIRDIVETDGHVTIVSFKDRVGLGRKRAIQILEAFDRLGFTRRLISYTRVKKELEKDHRVLRNSDLFVDEAIAA